MQNQWMLSPFFLDAPEPALRQLAGPDWWVNELPASAARRDETREAAAAPADPDSAQAGAAGAAVSGATENAAAAAPAPTGGTQLERMSEIHRPLAAHVAAIAAQGERPVCVGGDCCAVIPVLAGLQKAGIDPLVVWLDAHGDFNTHDTTLSGYVGGMPLAMITGRGHQGLMQGVGLRPLPDTDIVLGDARDLDPAERDLLDRAAVARFSDFQTLIDRLPDRPIHVHFDVDVLDPIEAPAMFYPVANGVAAATLASLLERLRQTRRLVSASMSPWALARDKDGRTAEACWRVFHALVGPPTV